MHLIEGRTKEHKMGHKNETRFSLRLINDERIHKDMHVKRNCERHMKNKRTNEIEYFFDGKREKEKEEKVYFLVKKKLSFQG